MTRYLLIDFGTTSTKSVLVDLDDGEFSHLQRHAAIPPHHSVPQGRHEVSLTAIGQRFDEICSHYFEFTASDPFVGIVLCSEMHGFAVLDTDTLAPLTPYISWLDQRSLELVDGSDTFALVTDHVGADRCRAITGMRPRPGFPLLNLTHWARTTSARPDSGCVVSLPGWLALDASRAQQSPAATLEPPPEHPTMLAAMALYDVGRAENSRLLLDAVCDLSGFRTRLGEPADAATVAGHWRRSDAAIPIYVGVGDHQCSVLGAGLGSGDASLNLGTGSQASVLGTAGADDSTAAAQTELRPYFDGDVLRTITHIPAGRALSEFVGFLQRLAATAHSDEPAVDFWQQLADLTAAELAAASLEFDLAVFEGARNFRHGGRIAAIEEGSLTPANYLASLLKSFVTQYVEVLQILDPDHELQRLLLSGGIARNLPNLRRFLSAACGYSVAAAADLDESLLGLRTLALVAAGRATTCCEAQQTFDGACVLRVC